MSESSEGSSSDMSHSDSEECDCSDSDNCLCALSGLSLNVLSKEDSFILEIIDKINDTDEKRRMLKKIIKIAKSEKKKEKENPQIDPGQYSLQKVFDKAAARYKEPSLQEINSTVSQIAKDAKERDVSIGDLQNEVKQIKKEIKWLKAKAKGKAKVGIEIEEPKEIQSDDEIDYKNDYENYYEDNYDFTLFCRRIKCSRNKFCRYKT